MTPKNLTRWLAPALLTSAVLAAPLAYADRHGDGHPPRMSPEEMCERLQSGEDFPGKDDRREEHQQRMEQRWAEMADRLQLTDEQRTTWDEIHTEQKAEWQDRMEERRQHMLERCNEMDDN